MNYFKKGKMIEVIWEDTSGESGWFRTNEVKEEVEKPALIRTVGFFLKKNKKRIVIVRSIANDSASGDYMKIPKGCIVQINELEKKETEH